MTAKRFVFIVALVAVSVMFLFASGASSIAYAPVYCDEYPQQPWMCANGDDTYSNWNYLFGSNFGYSDDTTGSSDLYGTDSSSQTGGNLENNYTPGTTWGAVVCTTSRGTKLFPPYQGGPWKIRGSGTVACPVVVNTIQMTLCIMRRTYPYGSSTQGNWIIRACKSRTVTYATNLHFAVHAACTPTGYRYSWKVQQLAYAYKSGYSPGTKIRSSVPLLYSCQ